MVNSKDFSDIKNKNIPEEVLNMNIMNHLLPITALILDKSNILLLVGYMVFNAVFNSNSVYIMAASAPIYAFLEFFQPFRKQTLVFTCLQYQFFENNVGKGDITLNEQFLHFPQCFLPVWRTCF